VRRWQQGAIWKAAWMTEAPGCYVASDMGLHTGRAMESNVRTLLVQLRWWRIPDLERHANDRLGGS